MFSSAGSPESPLCCSGAALSRHLPDCRLEPSSCAPFPGDKGKLHCLHSYRQGRMLLSLGLIGFPFPFLLTSPHPRNQSCFSKRLAAHIVMWCGIYCAAVLSGEEGVVVSVTTRIPQDGIETLQCSRWQILLPLGCLFHSSLQGQHALSLSVDLETVDEKTEFGLTLDPSC